MYMRTCTQAHTHTHTHMVAPVAPGPCMPDHAVCRSSPPALPHQFLLPMDTGPLSSSCGHAAMTSMGCRQAVPGSSGRDALRLSLAPGPWCMAGGRAFCPGGERRPLQLVGDSDGSSAQALPVSVLWRLLVSSVPCQQFGLFIALIHT